MQIFILLILSLLKQVTVAWSGLVVELCGECLVKQDWWLNCVGNVLVKLMNLQAVKIGKTGTRKFLTSDLKSVRICCNSCISKCHSSASSFILYCVMFPSDTISDTDSVQHSAFTCQYAAACRLVCNLSSCHICGLCENV